MTTAPTKIKCASPLEQADILHDLSMADDPLTACYGRFLKQSVPALDDWIITEAEHFPSTGLTVTDLSLVFISCIAQLTQIYATTTCKPGHSRLLMKTLISGIGLAFREHLAACEELDIARKAHQKDAASLVTILENILQQQKQDQTQ